MPSGARTYYVYQSPDGAPAQRTIRAPKPNGKKSFFQQRFEGGKWVDGLDGVRLYLYRLPELLAASPDRIVYIPEGEKDCDNLRARGELATTNPMGAGKWRPEYAEALRGRHVVGLPDNDPPGAAHGAQVAQSLRGIAASVKVVLLPGLPPKGDVSDWLAGGHPVEELRALIEAAPEWTPQAAQPQAGQGEAVTDDVRVRRPRPEISVGTDESRVVDEAIAALAQAPEVYVRGPEIVEIVTDAPTTRGVTRSGPLVRIHRSPEPRVRELLASRARWMAPGPDGDPREAHPPLWAVRAVVARGTWPAMRPLVGMAEAPTMRHDGTILAEPGYDPATGIYLAPSVQVSIPDRPTRDHAIAAANALGDVISEFPVASEAGRSAWIAGVITAAVRPAIDGPTPMLIVDASAPGSGKTLMADAAAMITTGREAARTTYVDDDAEMRKRITAIALVGDPLALLDNVVGTLGCPSLDAALTGTTWRDRVLGSSAMTAELPMRTVWWATGNGLVIGADLVRRALLVRLEPLCERPEERTGWRYPRLVDHVRSVRAELLTAALTIPRAYVVAGSPDQRLTPMGSYTAWSDLVRSAIVWAGMADPCATVGEIRACDPRADALRGVLDAWPAAPDAPVTVAELLAGAAPGTPWRAALVEWCPPRGADPLPTARVAGNRLRGVRRRVVGDRYVDAGPHGRGGVPWVLHVTGRPRPTVCDSVTPVTPVSRYACDERNLNMNNSGGDSHERHTVTDAEAPSPDTVDPVAQLDHCLRAKLGTTATDADKHALAEHFRGLNGTAEAAGQRLWSYWRSAPSPTVGDFWAREPKAKGGAT